MTSQRIRKKKMKIKKIEDGEYLKQRIHFTSSLSLTCYPRPPHPPLGTLCRPLGSFLIPHLLTSQGCV